MSKHSHWHSCGACMSVLARRAQPLVRDTAYAYLLKASCETSFEMLEALLATNLLSELSRCGTYYSYRLAAKIVTAAAELAGATQQRGASVLQVCSSSRSRAFFLPQSRWRHRWHAKCQPRLYAPRMPTTPP